MSASDPIEFEHGTGMTADELRHLATVVAWLDEHSDPIAFDDAVVRWGEMSTGIRIRRNPDDLVMEAWLAGDET